MPRQATYPMLLDNTLRIKISDFKKLSLLDIPDNIKYKQNINWTSSMTKVVTASITVEVINGMFYFDYTHNGTPQRYLVENIIEPSNLGKGFVHYFRCPVSKLKCRILYLYNGVFVHRSVCKGAMYEKQKESKKWREIDRIYGSAFGLDRMYEQLFAKRRKKYYKGKPTKWFAKLREQIKKGESIDVRDFERLLIQGL